MIEFECNNSGMVFSIRSDNGITFNAYCDGALWFTDLTASSIPEGLADKAIIKAIKNHINKNRINKSIDIYKQYKNIDNTGKRLQSFYIENSIYYRLKASGAKITPFINQAIMEKLERDGLLNQGGDI